MKRLVLIFLISFFLFSCNRKRDQELESTPNVLTDYFKDQIPKASSDTCLTIIVIGDWGYIGGDMLLVSLQMAALADYLGIDYIFTAGDNFYESGVSSVDDPLWSVYTDNFNESSLQVPWYVSLGNHDHLGNIQAQIDYTQIDERWNLPSAFYDKNFPLNSQGDSLGLIVIDSKALLVNASNMNQIEWIGDKAQNLETNWKIMIGHHPLYSYGYHGQNTTMKLLVEELLYENEFDMYIAGHDHDMQHIKTEGYTHYFVAGSTAKIRPTSDGQYSLYSSSEYGFMLLRVSKHVLQSYFINSDGDVLYQFKNVK